MYPDPNIGTVTSCDCVDCLPHTLDEYPPCDLEEVVWSHPSRDYRVRRQDCGLRGTPLTPSQVHLYVPCQVLNDDAMPGSVDLNGEGYVEKVQ